MKNKYRYLAVNKNTIDEFCDELLEIVENYCKQFGKIETYDIITHLHSDFDFVVRVKDLKSNPDFYSDFEWLKESLKRMFKNITVKEVYKTKELS